MVDISGIAVLAEDILFALKKDMLLKDVCYKVLEQRVINEAAHSRGIIVTAEEIQAEADRLRHELHLQKASDTLSWLAGQLVTVEEWEAGIHDRLLAQKLTEALFSEEVERFFAQHRLDFEQVLLYQIIIPYEQIAQEVYYEIEEEEISFYQAAHLYDIDEQRRCKCGYEGKIYRWNLKPEFSAVIFAANPKSVLGPIQTEQGFHLFMVEEFIPAQLTTEVRQDILRRLFQEWLQAELNHALHHQDQAGADFTVTEII
ncbi:peptidylprolyl isomerase [Pantanalinema rosaneae CENA516]|uniref:peptidylprolyl isomerase n=1 Tax=Pantanalinema rosaneae TaxID=1620701 RepID=UPI003D6E98EF